MPPATEKWSRGHFYYDLQSVRLASNTAVSLSSLGASLGFHATIKRTDADFTS